MSTPEVTFRALLRTIKTVLKDERDPETKEVVGHHLETTVQVQALKLDDEAVRMLAAIQGEGELVVEISRRQGALFKPAKEPERDEAH